MADIDDDDDLSGDEDYLYVEDAYDAADELAEHAIASPPYYEEDVSFDPYEYFADLEYNTDGYDDDKVTVVSGRRKGLKRRREDNESSPRKRKNVKGDNPNLSLDATVLWRRREKKVTDDKPMCNPATEDRKSFALLQDWRERFRDNAGLVIPSTVPQSQPDDDRLEEQRDDCSLSDMLSSQTISELMKLISESDKDLGFSEALQKLRAAGSFSKGHDEFDRQDREASLCQLRQKKDQLDQIGGSVPDGLQLHGTLDTSQTSVLSVPAEDLQHSFGDPSLPLQTRDCSESNQMQSNPSISSASSSLPEGRLTAADVDAKIEVSQRIRTVIEVRIPFKASDVNGEERSIVEQKVINKLTKEESSGKTVNVKGAANPTGPLSQPVMSGQLSKKRKVVTEDGGGARRTGKRICREGKTNSKRQTSECAVVEARTQNVRSTRSGKVWRN